MPLAIYLIKVVKIDMFKKKKYNKKKCNKKIALSGTRP